MKRNGPLLPAMLLATAIAATWGTVHAQGQAQPAPQGSSTSDEDHGAHHPSDSSSPPAAAPNSGSGAQGPSSSMGMGIGMMGSGMMGGDLGAMMQRMMPMMRGMMAQRMDRMDGALGMMSPRRVEGRIAFLRTELKITQEQHSAWNAFADALRAEARSMEALRQAAMGQGAGTGMGGADVPFPEQADRLVQSLTTRLEAARAIASAGRALYALLADEQKKTADELLGMSIRGM